MFVHVLLIEHRHGEDLGAYCAHEDAWTAVVGYVDEWWERELGDRKKPESADERVWEYFDSCEDEFYSIQRVEVLGDIT